MFGPIPVRYRVTKRKGKLMPKDPNDPNEKTPPKGDPSGATDPKDTKPGEGGNVFDPSKLSDDDLKKVLEDERLWKTERLAKLREDSKKLSNREKADADAEKERLKKEGKTAELLEIAQKERDEAVARAEKVALETKIINAAVAKGVKDTDAAVKLIDSSKIAKDDAGNYTGITEAVDSLVESRPYLINNTQSVGNPTNPGNNQTPAKFTMTQIQDPAFYQEHRDEIMKAQREGGITEDRNIIGTPTPAAGK